MDGNNSAKRVASAGLVDFAQFDSDYFLSREEVDQFKDEVKGRRRKDASDDPTVGLTLCLRARSTNCVNVIGRRESRHRH